MPEIKARRGSKSPLKNRKQRSVVAREEFLLV